MFILNNIMYKVCLATPAFGVLIRMLRLENYLKNIDTESFFFFDKQAGEIDVSLDNPAYDYLSDVDFVESSFFLA